MTDETTAAARTVVFATDPAETAARAHAELLRRAAVVRTGAADVPSPCVSVCRMNADRSFCEGCYRSIDEIRVWSRSDDAAKRVIWEQLMARVAATAV